MQKVVCDRCGFVWFVGDGQRIKFGALCAGCRMRPAKVVRSSFGLACRPWHGSFNEFDEPVLGDALFLPGRRLCGHSDCVEVSHIDVGGAC